jgi:hypothetical protein
MSEDIQSAAPEVAPVVNANAPETHVHVEAPKAPALGEISEQYRELVEAKGFKSTEDILKSYSNLEKMVGGSIRIPNPDSSEEARKEFFNKLASVEGVVKIPTNDEEKAVFYKKLGVPDTEDGYEVEALKAVNPDIEKNFRKLAHKLGLNTDQVKGLVDFEMSLQPSAEEIDQAVKQYNEYSLNTLKSAWGPDFDNRAKATLEVLNKYGEKYPDAVKELKETVGNNPALRIILGDLALTMQEKGTPTSHTPIGMSSEDAGQRIKDLESDKGFMKAYLDRNAIGHKAAVEKMTMLYKVKFGG